MTFWNSAEALQFTDHLIFFAVTDQSDRPQYHVLYVIWPRFPMLTLMLHAVRVRLREALRRGKRVSILQSGLTRRSGGVTRTTRGSQQVRRALLESC
jgi:hypothetical protein